MFGQNVKGLSPGTLWLGSDSIDWSLPRKDKYLAAANEARKGSMMAANFMLAVIWISFEEWGCYCW